MAACHAVRGTRYAVRGTGCRAGANLSPGDKRQRRGSRGGRRAAAKKGERAVPAPKRRRRQRRRGHWRPASARPLPPSAPARPISSSPQWTPRWPRSRRSCPTPSSINSSSSRSSAAARARPAAAAAPARQPYADDRTVIVKGLGLEVGEPVLRALFGPGVRGARLARNAATGGEARGFAYVELQDGAAGAPSPTGYSAWGGWGLALRSLRTTITHDRNQAAVSHQPRSIGTRTPRTKEKGLPAKDNATKT